MSIIRTIKRINKTSEKGCCIRQKDFLPVPHPFCGIITGKGKSYGKQDRKGIGSDSDRRIPHYFSRSGDRISGFLCYACNCCISYCAVRAAFLQNRKASFDEKIRIIAKGVGEENIITMSLIFLCAGAFSGAVSAAGGVDSTVNLGLSLIPAHFIVSGLFIISCFISVSMGTSMGTIAALAPIAAGISEEAGFPHGGLYCSCSLRRNVRG